MSKKILALTTYTGTIIGVGLFGLPYVTAQAGFVPVIAYFLILGTVVGLMSLMYGEIILRTPTQHRLPGYSRLYLNKNVERLTYITTIVGLTGSLLAYIIVGGEFLTSLLEPVFGGSTILYATIFFVLGAWLIYVGSGPVSRTELLGLVIFAIIMMVLGAKAYPYLHFSDIPAIHWSSFFLPYGVILFAISGTAVVPELREILKGQEHSMRSILNLGLILAIIAYLIFIIMVVGVTGTETTPEAMAGFSRGLGNGAVSLGFVFGIITTFTSFLTLGITLKKELNYDRGWPAWQAWLGAVVPAYLLYLAGFKDFIMLIGFIGAVALGIDTIVMAAIFLKARKSGQRQPAYTLRTSRTVVSAIVVLFVAGIVLELWSLMT